jgi:hypothetical protein
METGGAVLVLITVISDMHNPGDVRLDYCPVPGQLGGFFSEHSNN